MPTDSGVESEAAFQRPSGEQAQSDYDAIVVGAGFAGVRMLYEMRKRGLSARLLEKGSGPGGTWYWNRYPGARTDSPSSAYCFIFDKDLLQDWDWPERYAGQEDIEAYFNHVIDRFDLRRDMQFDTTVTSAVFDEEVGRWVIITAAGQRFDCDYFISATGVLHAAIEPTFPGIDSFEGEAYITSRWPKEPVDFVGKRVAIIGTGSSAVQVIPIAADDATDVTVFQRTPTYVMPARNQPVDKFERNAIKRNYDQLLELVRRHPFGYPQELPDRNFVDTPADQREAVLERAWELGYFQLVFFTYNDILTNREANDAAAEFVRGKIRAIVQDPETAELLCPNDHPLFSKRPPVGTNYYETFNRSNVRLVDVRSNPVRRITQRGIELEDGTEYEVDVIVYALGFDAATGSLTRIECRGREGQLLRDKWHEGPATYLGMTVEGFPNLFMLSGPGAQFSNFPPAIESQADWIGNAIAHVKVNEYDCMEPTKESADGWTALLEQIAGATLVPEGASVGSWIYGQNVAGKPKATYFFLGGVPMYVELMSGEANSGYPSFTFVSAKAAAGVS